MSRDFKDALKAINSQESSAQELRGRRRIFGITAAIISAGSVAAGVMGVVEAAPLITHVDDMNKSLIAGNFTQSDLKSVGSLVGRFAVAGIIGRMGIDMSELAINAHQKLRDMRTDAAD